MVMVTLFVLKGLIAEQLTIINNAADEHSLKHVPHMCVVNQPLHPHPSS